MTSLDTVSIPAQASHLKHKHGLAGFDVSGSLCWMFANANLVVWAANHGSELLASASLPCRVSRPLVSVHSLKVNGL